MNTRYSLVPSNAEFCNWHSHHESLTSPNPPSPAPRSVPPPPPPLPWMRAHNNTSCKSSCRRILCLNLESTNCDMQCPVKNSRFPPFREPRIIKSKLNHTSECPSNLPHSSPCSSSHVPLLGKPSLTSPDPIRPQPRRARNPPTTSSNTSREAPATDRNEEFESRLYYDTNHQSLLSTACHASPKGLFYVPVSRRPRIRHPGSLACAHHHPTPASADVWFR